MKINTDYYTFKLDNEDAIEFENWKKVQIQKNPGLPAAGERWCFCFTPTGLGLIIVIKDLLTDDELDLSHTENW